MAREFIKLDYEMRILGDSLQALVGPENIVAQLETSISTKHHKRPIYQRRRELLFLGYPPIFTEPAEGHFRLAELTDVPYLIDLYVKSNPNEIEFQVEPLITNRVVQGYAYVWDYLGPKSYACFTHQDDASIEISTVMTEPLFRGRGFASGLVGHMSSADNAPRAGRLPTLFVDEDNVAARRIYTRLGFRSLGWWRIVKYN